MHVARTYIPNFGSSHNTRHGTGAHTGITGKEVYNQAPSHDTGHGTGAHWQEKNVTTSLSRHSEYQIGRNSCGGTTTALGQLQAASQNSLLGHVQLQRSRGCQAQRRCRVAPRSADARDGHGQGGRQLWSRGLVLSALDHGALLHARSRQMHVFCTRPNWRDADERGSRHRVQHIEPHQPCPGRE